MNHPNIGHWMLLGSLIVAASDWLAVARRRKRLQHLTKPAALSLILVAAWFLKQGPHDAWQARFFLPGLAFSLAGDAFLLLPGKRHFLLGLLAFLLAHLCYIVGLNPTFPPEPAFVLLVVIGAGGLSLYRNVAAGLRRRDREQLLIPVAIYSLVLSLMLFSAWATLFRTQWTSPRRMLVITGASLFFVSDAMLAWDRFVASSPSARLRVRITYHLGQIALAASIALPT